MPVGHMECFAAALGSGGRLFRSALNKLPNSTLATAKDGAVGCGPNGEAGDVRDHGGNLAPILTLPGVVVKATRRSEFAIRSATFRLLG